MQAYLHALNLVQIYVMFNKLYHHSTMKKERHSYNPNGTNSRQIGLRFTGDEFLLFDALAKEENRSLSNLARIAALKGLDVLLQEKNGKKT